MIPTLIRLHGSLMVIAWMFLCTNGIILSRHYKHVWKKRGLKGLDAWLIAHQVFHSMTLICSAVATFVIVYFVQGYSYLNPSPFGAHPICGFTSIGLVLLNPVIALCRCPLTSSRRAIFNVVHKFLGLLAVALAIPTITLGLIMLRNMTVTTSPYSILTVFQAFVILYIITELALESIDYWVLVQERSATALVINLYFQNNDAASM
ncbi:hypothetical protein D915_001879 [Fasciola hepatica]|uniref:ascorbate ferrireductase (transmembrane) n=1 Tax=Fasciola hepatica TaxID=6192 RepID=A0A4E0RIH4_FASHE|nr:hypothetical protein D915_001879 [Fasciola hepatica]